MSDEDFFSVMRSTAEARAYEHGQEAWGDGQKLIANPYPARTYERFAWAKGWRTQDQACRDGSALGESGRLG